MKNLPNISKTFNCDIISINPNLNLNLNLTRIMSRKGYIEIGSLTWYMRFIGMRPREFWTVMDKWYNKKLFFQDQDGV